MGVEGQHYRDTNRAEMGGVLGIDLYCKGWLCCSHAVQLVPTDTMKKDGRGQGVRVSVYLSFSVYVVRTLLCVRSCD